MSKKLALILSYLFHPLLMTTAGVIFILFSGTYISFIPLEAKRMIILLVAIGTLLLPAVMIPLFMLRGVVSDMYVNIRRERIIPMGVTLLFYILTFILFLRIPVYRFIHAFILGSTISLFINFLLNFRWKISAHMMGLGGLTALIIALSIYLNANFLTSFLTLLLVTGITGTARLYLSAHEDYEVYLGYLLGLVVMGIVLAVY